MSNDRERQCVYTCLFGNYEELQPQPIRERSGLPFICFTDRADLSAEGWEIRVVEPSFATDSARSSRHAKILPHLFLHDYDASLYIDNTVRLLAPPEQALAEMLPDPAIDACFLSHSFRVSLWDEFGAVQAAGLDTPERIAETLDFVLAVAPDVLDQKPYKGAMMARRHNRETVVGAMEHWWLLVCRYSRRDQLTLPVAIHQANANIRIVDWDIRATHLQQWPVETNRNREDYWQPVLRAGKSKMTALLQENHELQTKVAQSDSVVLQLEATAQNERAQIADLTNVLNMTLTSRSWRLTRPLRWLAALFKTA